MSIDGRKRWLALYVLCLGDLMIVLDTTIVNVALPSIRTDLGFTEASLAWVVNAYLLTFGGFLLLAGRLGDLYGQRRLFLIGITSFTVASLACGVANSKGFLVGARAVQGLGGAIVSAIALSLIMILFTQPAERAKAMGVVGSVFALCLALLPSDNPTRTGRLDIAGAVTVTASLMLAVYAIVNGNQEGWTSGQTLGMLAGAVVLLAAFLAIEARVSAPLMPLGLFRIGNVASANVTGILLAGAMFAWFFLSALYLQRVLGYSPLEVGLGFLPATLVWGTSSLFLSDKLVMRFGIKVPLIGGLLLYTAVLLLFARAPTDGNFFVDILPGMLLIGLGGGITFNPILLAAMGSVEPSESGLASGVVNTSFMMGGALGLAILASVAASRTDSLTASGHGPLAALTGGYHVAFIVGAVFAVVAAAVAGGLIHADVSAPAHGGEEAAGFPAAAEVE